MLQRDSATGGDAGELHVVDHKFAVEQHGGSVALHRDVEAVPLADRFVRAPRGNYAASSQVCRGEINSELSFPKSRRWN